MSAGEQQKVRRAVVKANRVVTDQFTAKKLKSARGKELSKKGIFADSKTSVEFYNSLPPELKKRALLNSKGYLSTLQYDLTRGQVINADKISGEYASLPEGQASPEIGEIKIGATYVQEMLNSMTKELNDAIFSIFQSVKDVQEGSYAFMAGGLKDESEADRAIAAADSISTETEELKDTK